MKLIATPLEDAFLIEPKVFGDERGFFMESWNEATFSEAGLPLAFVQDNHSRSARGVLRGLHFQNPNPQGKLVRVVRGQDREQAQPDARRFGQRQLRDRQRLGVATRRHIGGRRDRHRRSHRLHRPPARPTHPRRS